MLANNLYYYFYQIQRHLILFIELYCLYYLSKLFYLLFKKHHLFLISFNLLIFAISLFYHNMIAKKVLIFIYKFHTSIFL